MNKKHVAITLGIMCFILTLGIMIQLKTIKSTLLTVGQGLKENGLRDEVLKWKEKYDKTYEELTSAENGLEKERQVGLSSDSGSVQKQEKLKELNTYLGLNDVTGEGIVITLQDNTSSKFGTANDLVHDGDLREIVNEIKNIGADAISINGQRVVPSTAITCAGTVIQINNESIGSPFVIRVIGNGSNLYNNLTRPGSYIKILQEEYGLIIDIKKNDNILIEKYNGVLTDKYIEYVE